MVYACLSTSITQSRSQNSRGSTRITSRPNKSHLITPTDWRISARPDLGFLQSCTQIRSEYLSIHVAHTQLGITLSSLVRYTRTVDSARSLGYTDHFTLPIGTVTLSFRKTDWVPDPCNRLRPHPLEYCQALDIAPLLRTYARFPGARLNIEESATYLSALFDVHSNTAWRATLLRDTYFVRLFHDYAGKINVQIQVKQACAQPWMRTYRGGWISEYPHMPGSGDRLEWLERAGLGGLLRARR